MLKTFLCNFKKAKDRNQQNRTPGQFTGPTVKLTLPILRSVLQMLKNEMEAWTVSSGYSCHALK